MDVTLCTAPEDSIWRAGLHQAKIGRKPSFGTGRFYAFLYPVNEIKLQKDSQKYQVVVELIA
ncbi:hypothetical protein [Roseibium sp.]|uniref:hypothetical protein n=1 Tax=Roseibium sp. TaxID=1936156 RepID=UPI003262E92D